MQVNALRLVRVARIRFHRALVAGAIAMLLLSQAAGAAEETAIEVLHEFSLEPEGSRPAAVLVLGSDGSLHGTTADGGANDAGTIFKLDSAGVLTTLHSFEGFQGIDSGHANGLTRGADGSLYGTTSKGGEYLGVIFRLKGAVGPGGRRVPGDCNSDGRLNLSDAVSLLQFLFLGATQGLPCGSGRADDNANLHLLDHNGDQRIDLSDPVGLLGYLFLAGPPPHSGLDCVEVPGCSAACPQ